MLSEKRTRPTTTVLIALFTLLLSAQGTSAQGLDWQQVSSHGFDSRENWWVGSLSVFGDHLYAGTWNPLGAEIWRSPDGAEWSQLVSSGLGDTHNQGVVAAHTFDGALYVGLYNSHSGAAIWRCTDGLNWISVQRGGFGDATNGAVVSMAALESALYVGTWNFSHGAQVWRSSNGTDWVQANASGFGDANNEEVQAMVTFAGLLYAGTYNQTSGAQVWRTADGDSWEQIIPNGFGNPNNVEISSMAIHRATLYAATRDQGDGGELWRTYDGFNWFKVDSWPAAAQAACMVVHDGSLFIGTAGEEGAEVWSSRDGVHWVHCNDPGFGDAGNKSTLAAGGFHNQLYVATSNPSRGAVTYRTSGHGVNIAMTAESAALCEGEKQSYDVVLQNSGNHALTRITLTDKLPGLTEFLPNASSSGAHLDASTGSVTWDVGTLLPGESFSLHIEVRMPASVVDSTPITNRIRVEAQGVAPKEVEVTTTLVRCAPSTVAPRETPKPTETSQTAWQGTKTAPPGPVSPPLDTMHASSSEVSLDRFSGEGRLYLPTILKPFPSG